MTTAAQIRDITAQQLIGATLAATKVFTPLTFPTWDGTYPMIFLQPPDERGISSGPNGAPAYVVTATLLIAARVEKPVLPNDAGAIAALVDLELMLAQIKRQIINNPAFWNVGLQEFSNFMSKCSVETKDMVLGEALFSIDMIYRQDADLFYQEDWPYLEAVEVDVGMPNGTPDPGLRVELYPSDAVVQSITTSQAALDQTLNTDLPGSVGGQTPSE